MPYNDSTNTYTNTKFVVDANGETPYSTIQSAIDAATGEGNPAEVYIRAGSYAESLTHYDNISIKGAGNKQVFITGINTPPTTGTLVISNVSFISATHAFDSAAAGTTTIVLDDVLSVCTNGYTFNLPNWGSGDLYVNNVQCSGTNDGFLNNTGDISLLAENSTLGIGAGNTLIANGEIEAKDCEFGATMTITGASTSKFRDTKFTRNLDFTVDSVGELKGCLFDTGATIPLSCNSTGNVSLSNITLDTTNTTAIDGNGTVVLGNINFLDGKEIASTITQVYSASIGLISPYVVGSTGNFSTIQEALDAATSTGNQEIVYIQGGTFTEDLTLYDKVSIEGYNESNTTIIGTHTPPTSGIINIRKLTLQGSTAIFSSVAAGTTTILVKDCTINVSNGYMFDLLNWTGDLTVFDLGSIGTDDGVVKNTGGATLFFSGATLGNGTTQNMTIHGNTTFENVSVQCPISFEGSTVANLSMGCKFLKTITTAGTANISISESLLSTGSDIAITHNSSTPFLLSNVTIDSTAAPHVITGSGTVNFGGVTFPSLSSVNTSITTAVATQVVTGRTHIGTGYINNSYHMDVVETGAGRNIRGRFSNTNTSNSLSHASFFCVTGGPSGGDPYFKVQITGGAQYSWGIDNSDSDKMKITNGGHPSSGSELWSLTTAGAATFNSAFTFPTVDGSNDEVLITDGAGNVSWGAHTNSGELIKCETTSTSSVITCNTVLPSDATIPQNTEGNEVITLAFTPLNSSSLLEITFSASGEGVGTNNNVMEVGAALFKDSTANALTAVQGPYSQNDATGVAGHFYLKYFETAGSTSSRTYKIRIGPHTTNETFYVNGTTAAASIYGGVCKATITVKEIKV